MDETLLALARQLARLALREDIGPGDVTGAGLLSTRREARADIRVKAEGVIAGLDWPAVVLGEHDPTASVELRAQDGDSVKPGTVVATVTGSEATLVACERTILNLMQRLSGIATLTARFVAAVAGTRAEILDTRKTTPGLRAFEKYAVRCGGGVNHRMGLYDEAMIKENHLRLSGYTLPDAIARLRAGRADLFVTAEAESYEEARAALLGGADVVLLDELSLEDIARAKSFRDSNTKLHRVKLEISGGVRLENVRKFAETGVERISIGALTHSAPALDISMKVAREG